MEIAVDGIAMHFRQSDVDLKEFFDFDGLNSMDRLIVRPPANITTNSQAKNPAITRIESLEIDWFH